MGVGWWRVQGWWGQGSGGSLGVVGYGGGVKGGGVAGV